MKNITYAIIIVIGIISSCTEEKRYVNPYDTVLYMDPSGSNTIDDSVLFRIYLEEDYKTITEGGYKLDTDMKIGLYSASCSHLGLYDKALSCLPNLKNPFYSKDKDRNELHIQRTDCSYEMYSIYIYERLKNKINDSTSKDMLHVSIQLDKKNSLAWLDLNNLEVRDDIKKGTNYYRGIVKLDTTLKYLIKTYPKAYNLFNYNIENLIISGNYDSIVSVCQFLYKRDYYPEKQLENLLYIYNDKIRDEEKLKYYSTLLTEKFPEWKISSPLRLSTIKYFPELEIYNASSLNLRNS